MLIRLSHDLQNVNILRQTVDENGTWDKIQFTEDSIEECDILLCLSYPNEDIKVKCSETWLLSQEPPARIRRWERDSYPYFDRIFSTWPDLPIPSQPCTHWFPDFTYNELCRLQPPHKSKDLSWITSTNSDLHGHKLRMQFIKNLNKTKFNFDLFGRGFTYITNKADGLLDYKYSFAIENFSAPDYWTEKIADCFLCWNIPLYWGATNIDKYFPAGSYIKIDPTRPKLSRSIIAEAIENNYYETHIEQIREARDLVLNKYQLFPHISQLTKEFFTIAPRKDRFIPKNTHPQKDHGFRKLIYKLNYNLSKYFNL